MARPKVVQELSDYFATLLRSGLRAGRRGEGLFPVYWGHPRDLDAHPEIGSLSPLVGLCLLQITPETRVRATRVAVEADGGLTESSSIDASLVAAPFWVACRYLLSIRSDDPVEEQELAAAALQVLLDNPVVPLEHFDSLAPEPWLGDTIAGFPITVRRDAGIWRDHGLSRHHLLLTFDVTLPLPSSRRRKAARVVERRVALDLLERREEAPDDAR